MGCKSSTEKKAAPPPGMRRTSSSTRRSSPASSSLVANNNQATTNGAAIACGGNSSSATSASSALQKVHFRNKVAAASGEVVAPDQPHSSGKSRAASAISRAIAERNAAAATATGSTSATASSSSSSSRYTKGGTSSFTPLGRKNSSNASNKSASQPKTSLLQFPPPSSRSLQYFQELDRQVVGHEGRETGRGTRTPEGGARRPKQNKVLRRKNSATGSLSSFRSGGNAAEERDDDDDDYKDLVEFEYQWELESARSVGISPSSSFRGGFLPNLSGTERSEECEAGKKIEKADFGGEISGTIGGGGQLASSSTASPCTSSLNISSNWQHQLGGSGLGLSGGVGGGNTPRKSALKGATSSSATHSRTVSGQSFGSLPEGVVGSGAGLAEPPLLAGVTGPVRPPQQLQKRRSVGFLRKSDLFPGNALSGSSTGSSLATTPMAVSPSFIANNITKGNQTGQDSTTTKEEGEVAVTPNPRAAHNQTSFLQMLSELPPGDAPPGRSTCTRISSRSPSPPPPPPRQETAAFD